MAPLARRWWIAALLLGAALGAVAHLPLRLVVAWSGSPELARTLHLEGTPWRWHGTTATGVRLAFDAAPHALLIGRYAGDLTVELDGARLDGRAARHLDGTLSLSDGELTADLAPLARALGMPPALLRGTLEVEGLEAVWRPGGFEALACVGAIADLRAGDAASGELALGSLSIGCEMASGGPLVTVADDGGVLALEARIALGPDGRFLLEGSAGARPGAPPELAAALPLLGRSTGPDQVSFRYAGALPGLAR